MSRDGRHEPPKSQMQSKSSESTQNGVDAPSATDERKRTIAHAGRNRSRSQHESTPVMVDSAPLIKYCTAEAINGVALDQHDECRSLQQTVTKDARNTGAGQLSKPHDEDSDDEEKGPSLKKIDPSQRELWDDYPDGGRAWLVVLGAALFCCTQMAYGLTWGVFLSELKEGPHKDVPLSILNLVVGLSNFLMAVTSFAAGRLGELYGYKRVLAINIILTYITMIVGAFVYENLVGLFLAQGAVLGIVMGLGLPLYLSIPSQWFKKKRGLATGLCAGGSGFGGGIFCLINRAMLPKLGYRNTLLIYGSINFVLCCIGWLLLKERKVALPCGSDCVTKTRKQWLPAGIWSRGSFWSFETSVFIAVFGFLTPFYYLTSYTTLKCPELDPTSLAPAAPLIIANFVGGVGRIASGIFADKFGPVNALFTTFFLGGLLQCVFWPFTNSYGSIIAYAVFQGAFGNWYMSLIPVVAAKLFGVQGLATIVGFTVLVNSPGQLAGASISGVVLARSGGSYQAVAWYAGGVMIAGSFVLLYGKSHIKPALR
ncbi:hypothetical protein OIO90_000336 [Microbotryomycetes sp. JL221]|nr:hypothetical protein OIO90_000336 [Microbotryomycetes sp. JL221]